MPENDDFFDQLPEMVQVLPFVNYARLSTLSRDVDRIYGRFAPSFAGACALGTHGYLLRNAIVRETRVSNCSDGDPVIKFENH
jgi:hypothetical protein